MEIYIMVANARIHAFLVKKISTLVTAAQKTRRLMDVRVIVLRIKFVATMVILMNVYLKPNA